MNVRHDPISMIALGAALAAALLTPTAPLGAQHAADSAGVRAAVLDYLAGFYEGDTARIVRSVHPESHKYGYFRARDSTTYAGEPMSYAEMIAYANNFKRRGRTTPATAPREVTLFDVQDQTASAKLRAWWGTDYLLLARINGRWMVTHVLWQSPPPASR
jgi:hypothetical protein